MCLSVVYTLVLDISLHTLISRTVEVLLLIVVIVERTAIFTTLCGFRIANTFGCISQRVAALLSIANGGCLGWLTFASRRAISFVHGVFVLGR